RAERNTGLLNRGDGRGSDVLLATFRASHDALSDKSPADTDTNADQKDRQQQGSKRPGRHQQPKPEHTPPTGIWPPAINRPGHSSESDATVSAAPVHASDAPATMYPAVSGLTACNRCRHSGAYIASGLYAIDKSQTIHSPAPVAEC